MSKNPAARLAIALLTVVSMSRPAEASVESYQLVSATTPLDTSASKSVEVECPPGTSLLGGGAYPSNSSGNRAPVASQALLDFGSGDAIGWTAEMREVFPGGGSWWLGVTAICGDVPGLERVGDSTASDSIWLKELVVECPLGKTAISGGFEIEGAIEGVTVTTNSPEDHGTGVPLGWKVSANEVIETTNNWSLRAQALCADVDALVFTVSTGLGNQRDRRATLYCPDGYVAMGGGGRLGGSLVDWINESRPVLSGEAWSVTFQRESGDTRTSTVEYSVVCPEPRAATQGILALAILAARCRRRCVSERP